MVLLEGRIPGLVLIAEDDAAAALVLADGERSSSTDWSREVSTLSDPGCRAAGEGSSELAVLHWRRQHIGCRLQA